MQAYIVILSIFFTLLSGCGMVPKHRVPAESDETAAISNQCTGNQTIPDSEMSSGTIEIKEIQARLILFGYRIGQIDGVYGKKTKEGIRAYQADYKLLTDGRPSTELLEHMKSTQRTAGNKLLKIDSVYASQSYE